MKMRYHTVQCSKSQCCKSLCTKSVFKVERHTLRQKEQLGQYLLQLALKVQKGNKLPVVPI